MCHWRGSRSCWTPTTQGFSRAVAEIDRRLRGEIKELQEHRRRIAQLAAGDSLALPPEVTAYLDRMRSLGTPDALVQVERDAWILIAAQWPDRMAEYMAVKQAQLDDPLMQRFLLTMGALLDGNDESEELLAQTADVLAEMSEQAAARGELDQQDADLTDSSFVDLLDTVVLSAGPRMVRLRDRILELLAERGWSGLIKLERVDGDHGSA